MTTSITSAGVAFNDSRVQALSAGLVKLNSGSIAYVDGTPLAFTGLYNTTLEAKMYRLVIQGTPNTASGTMQIQIQNNLGVWITGTTYRNVSETVTGTTNTVATDTSIAYIRGPAYQSGFSSNDSITIIDIYANQNNTKTNYGYVMWDISYVNSSATYAPVSYRCKGGNTTQILLGGIRVTWPGSGFNGNYNFYALPY